MAYLREFEDDVFISYARLDNQPLKDGEEGWISKFHRLLEVLLRRRLGVDPVIWRDIDLAGNDYLSDTLINRISKVALLVSVLSPGYMNSRWCMRELQEFCKIADQAGGLRVDGDKARIFKVLPMPISPEEHPPELKEFTGYEFFAIDIVTNKAQEFVPELGDEAYSRFLAKAMDLAHDISEVIKRLKQKIEGDEKTAAAGPVIYLAETSSDQAGARDAIKRELQERGCVIVPNRTLFTAPDFERAVSDDLARAKLSVHIIGKKYGWIPENAECSMVHLQTEIASRRSGDPGFRRLIWLPDGLTTEDDRQRKFIDYVRSDPSIQKSAEFLEGSLEKLKGAVEKELAKIRSPGPAATIAREVGPRRIYLIHDKADADAVAPISEFLFSEGFEPIQPLMEGDEAQVREDHKDNLATCDAALIYHGAASDIWLRTKRSDLKKAAGFGRDKPMLGQAIYLGAPETPQKQSFRTHEADVVKNFGTFTPDALTGFLSKIRKEIS
jgi:TIR domain